MQQVSKVILVFPDTWISYSPTVLNLGEIISEQSQIVIITTGKEKYIEGSFNAAGNIRLEFVEFHSRTLQKLIRKLDLAIISALKLLFTIPFLNRPKYKEFWIGYNIENWLNIFRFRKAVRKSYQSGDVLIGVDAIGLLALSSFRIKVHLVSLEISKNFFHWLINWRSVGSLLIQTPERKGYWIPKQFSTIRTYYVQNSPIAYRQSVTNGRSHFRDQSIIYLGNLALDYNALKQIADSLNFLPNSFKVILKGMFNTRTDTYFRENYDSFIQCGRLQLNYDYIPSHELALFLDRFSYGVTFYDLASLEYPLFNVESCPSGKLFSYYNSNLPVVGNNILGLKSIQEYHAGEVIGELTGEAIAAAVLKIEGNYEYYREGSANAAQAFDFRKNLMPFLENELPINESVS